MEVNLLQVWKTSRAANFLHAYTSNISRGGVLQSLLAIHCSPVLRRISNCRHYALFLHPDDGNHRANEERAHELPLCTTNACRTNADATVRLFPKIMG